jgi:hypothetical protein
MPLGGVGAMPLEMVLERCFKDGVGAMLLFGSIAPIIRETFPCNNLIIKLKTHPNQLNSSRILYKKILKRKNHPF